ncbi:Capsular polysaccharide biosynthesis protein [Atopostipes suicloacalis DSM 15692]|uniref:Capsular polysaccharide biosynthesis protein CpsC n=1 Tax=Atopostipes suicloacalis DSM 15692 TaxID=1121025 RepID=A0A1M4X278_9LACT|nr:Wzz/FepE/Etk N-terminal domain-containing protein [Atopostipes suicloacalis]SHE87453.1 Capsular polysaccharide biosynthesis protein [Atopostipes suicloacalis DSM 15692]
MEEEISLVELFDILKKHIRVIILTTVLTAVIATIYTFFLVTPKYQSSTEMLVSHSSDSTTQNVTQQDINTSIQLINTYSDIIRNDVTLDPVIEELDLDMTTKELREDISVQTENDSQVFSIQVQSKNPYQATEIANTIANYFQNEIYEIMNVDNVTIISSAIPNVDPISPNNMLNVIIGVLLGGMIGIGIVFVRELMDNTVKTEKQVEQLTEWNNLGEVNIFTKEDLVVRTPLPKSYSTKENEKTNIRRTRRRV